MFIVQYINNKVLFAVLIYVANKAFIVIKYRKCGRRVIIHMNERTDKTRWYA